MFPRTQRLAARREIIDVQKHPPFFSQHFVLKAAVNQQPFVKVAVVVSTKVSKSAVIRNRLKRQVRETLRSLLKEIGGWNIMVTVKKRFNLAIIIHEELEFLLNKAKITRR